jgi:DNA-binding transcriptional MerR regulator
MAKLLQQLGFTLEEIIDCLHAHDAGNATCEGEMWRLDAVLGRIDARIAELRRTRRLVTSTMDECRSGQCRFASER